MFKIYIPDYVIPTDTQRIKDLFRNLEIADIKSVEFVPHAEEEYSDDSYTYNYMSYGGAYIYINYWYDNDLTDNLKAKILAGDQEARIVYNDPEYWVLEMCQQDDLDSLISDINYRQSETIKTMENMQTYIDYNYKCITYLLREAKKTNMKHRTIKRLETNYKHRKAWLKRLRNR